MKPHVFVGEQSGPCAYQDGMGGDCGQPWDWSGHLTATDMGAVPDQGPADGGPGEGWSVAADTTAVLERAFPAPVLDQWQRRMGVGDQEVDGGPYPVRRMRMDHAEATVPVLEAWHQLTKLGVTTCLVTYWHKGSFMVQLTWGELFGYSVEDLGQWAREG